MCPIHRVFFARWVGDLRGKPSAAPHLVSCQGATNCRPGPVSGLHDFGFSQSALCRQRPLLLWLADCVPGARPQMFKLLQRHRSPEEKTLIGMAAETGEKLPLFFGFNALGDH